MADTPIPVLPPEEAIAFFEAKGLAKSFAWQDIWTAQHDFFFTVAKMLEVSLLEDVRDLIAGALKDGRSPQQLGKELKALLRERGWWGKQLQDDPLTGETKAVQLGSNRRVRTIVNTNLRTSYGAGRYARQERVSKLLDILVYKSRMDGRERPQHHAWHNTALPIGDPWWRTHYPPCDWGCRCRTVSMSRKMAERRGLNIGEAPAYAGTRKWVNKRTGEVMEIERGIGAGWDYHPGRAQIEGLAPDPLFDFSKVDEGDAIAAAEPSAIARFLGRFDLPKDGGVWRDESGWPLALSRRWLMGLSRADQEKAAAASLAIVTPDEIRAVWVRGKDDRAMLIRRYILAAGRAGFVVDIGVHGWRFARVTAAGIERARASGVPVWTREGAAIAAYDPGQRRDEKGRWTRGGVGGFVVHSWENTSSQALHSLGTVSGNAPPDVIGFERFLSAETVRKVLGKHGRGGTNEDDDPISQKDFALIDEITTRGSWTDVRGKGGRRTVEYRHIVGGRRMFYVEVVGSKHGRTIVKSLYVPKEI